MPSAGIPSLHSPQKEQCDARQCDARHLYLFMLCVFIAMRAPDVRVPPEATLKTSLELNIGHSGKGS